MMAQNPVSCHSRSHCQQMTPLPQPSSHEHKFRSTESKKGRYTTLSSIALSTFGLVMSGAPFLAKGKSLHKPIVPFSIDGERSKAGADLIS